MDALNKALLWTGGVTVFALGCLAIVQSQWGRFKLTARFNAAMVYGIFWALVIGAFILVCVSFNQQDQEIQALLAGLTGAAAGWILGIWISPTDSSETTSFARYWTAIGVGSGVTLKWAFDQITDPGHRVWFHTHWLVAEVFVIACLATTGAVYSARAYGNSLNIRARKSAGYSAEELAANPIQIKRPSPITFYAEIVGPSDSLSLWSVQPPNLGTISAEGVFSPSQTAADKGSGKIIAVNVEDPSLSNSISIELA